MVSSVRSGAREYQQARTVALDTDIPISIQEIDVGVRSMPILVADCDVVMQMYIDADEEDRDPYWTCPWPSSIALARELLEKPELVKGKRVADIGCGLGIAGIAAAISGASEVVFLDREPLALQCAVMNAQLNGLGVSPQVMASVSCSGLPKKFTNDIVQITYNNDDSSKNQQKDDRSDGTSSDIRAKVFDWSADIEEQHANQYDVIMACDILYEKFSVEVGTTSLIFLLLLHSYVYIMTSVCTHCRSL